MSSKFFGIRAVMRHWELMPLAVMIGGVVTMASSFSIYAISTKPDVRVHKSLGSPAWEEIEGDKRQKLITINQKYEKIPELDSLRKEIGSYKY